MQFISYYITPFYIIHDPKLYSMNLHCIPDIEITLKHPQLLLGLITAWIASGVLSSKRKKNEPDGLLMVGDPAHHLLLEMTITAHHEKSEISFIYYIIPENLL
jgi:hypothetical protein